MLPIPSSGSRANYIVYTPGHRRHHSGSQKHLIPLIEDRNAPGGIHNALAFQTLEDPEHPGNWLPLAFMSVTGAADGSLFYTNPGTYPVQVGNKNIYILVVYAPIGNGCPSSCPTITFVDAFNADIGAFSDSDFVQVLTGNAVDTAATQEANENGDVPSQNAKMVRAFPRVDSVPFLKWKKIEGAEEPNLDYSLATGETGFLFAFYKTKKVPRPICKPRIPAPPICMPTLLPWCHPDVICRSIMTGCGHAINIGCPAIDPVPVDDFANFLKKIGVRTFAELAKKQNSARVKQELAKLSPAKRKVIRMMLKRISQK